MTLCSPSLKSFTGINKKHENTKNDLHDFETIFKMSVIHKNLPKEAMDLKNGDK